MRKTLAFVAAAILIAAGSTACALIEIADTGIWPQSWPSELEPLRKQSKSYFGPGFGERHFAISFKNREEFEAAWPHILNVKTQGAPIFLVNRPGHFLGKNQTGVVIHCPPEGQPLNPELPKGPFEGNPHELRFRWRDTNFIELTVDGDIVDLNRIPLPVDTPIFDERFAPPAQ
ncbi:MAG: hypothetical protein H6824_01995 [Planctomycetaceae bacterium]|nr:hypothetical protein [Planctomycetaceae bacterium]